MSEAPSDPADPHDLQRFVAAQAPVYAQVRAELARGRKQSHWMWFVFPQLKELGRSATARHYGIDSRAEAAAYLAHPLLGARLVECTKLMLAVEGKGALDVLGPPDDLKFRSSMTLFAAVAAPASVYAQALERFFAGVADARTLALLAAS
jgi:uncharacterized protein (DUF1810 family)